jgi:hypothetical protein
MTISDINNKVYFLTKTNSTALAAADLLILVNNAYERIASLIMQSDGRWQWDDSNQTDLPIATTSLVADQNDYSLAVTHLQIERVEVKNSDGIWGVVDPIDRSDIGDMPLNEYFKNSGIPDKYDILGSSIFLWPAPNYSQSASLRIYFKRAPALFTSTEVTTGTKVPGFNSLYHDLIPLWASYDYALANGLPNANQLLQEIVRKEDALKKDFSFRQPDDRKRITMAPISFR